MPIRSGRLMIAGAVLETVLDGRQDGGYAGGPRSLERSLSEPWDAVHPVHLPC